MLPRHLDQFGKQLSAREARFACRQRRTGPAATCSAASRRPKALLKQPSLLLGGEPVVITPIGNDWLQPDQVFVVSDVSFEFLAAGANWRDFAATSEMIRELRSPSTDLGNDVRVAIHTRLMQPFLDTTLLLLGLPFVITRTNRNPFLVLGLCLAVVTIFMLVVLGCQSLGSSGWLAPALAAWLPLMLFAPLAAALYDALRQ